MDRTKEEQRLLQALTIALDVGHIWPAFQPLVDLRTKSIYGFEVLARWSDPELGDISPAVFVPLAENSGLISLLTDLIVREATRLVASTAGDFILAFNMSAAEFRNPALLEFLKNSLAPSQFPLSRICIEVTESVLFDDDEQARETFLQLKNAGITMALDDFGTGFSSLSRLHSFSFDKLKIDKSFVESMERDVDSRKIITSVIGLGQSLGMRVVAEGVETTVQADGLRDLGCDIGQGWIFGKPKRWSEAQGILQALPSRRTNVIDASPFQRLHQLDALYKTAPVGLCFLDLSFRHVSVNEHFAKFIGLDPEEIVGRTISQIWPEPDASQIAERLSRVLEEKTMDTLEYDRGSRGVFIIINQRVEDGFGTLLGISSAAIDITHQRSLEKALQEAEERYSALTRKMNSLNPGSSEYSFDLKTIPIAEDFPQPAA
ncbi:sensor domain-containing phosphodiesterase [Rhizobium sp. A37_96]